MSTATAELPNDFEHRRVIERPSGFFWENTETGEEAGPFATLAEAIADMEYLPDDAVEPDETLEEAEEELGISDWIDPETGEPATPTVPRIEDY